MPQKKTTPVSTKWIWPFELIEQIGEGGMGVVYRARYVVNNREVALKMLPGDVTDRIALARFERELEVLKNLKHPNIVRCFGGVSEDKQRFYAMELVPGGSLEDELQRRGRFSVEQVIAYGLQMCAALECSHQSGVVHRDIKPSNFLIGKDKQLKLSDFGLASVAASRRITAAGKTAGTLLYMSPEQIRGGELTAQTDLYALGCVFYELLTGKPPYVGESPAQTMHMHCRAEIPRVSKEVLDCPPGLDKLIYRLMAKEPAQRPQSAAEVAKDLRLVSNTITVKIDPKRLLLEAKQDELALPPVMRGDLEGNDHRPYQRSRTDKMTLLALVVTLVASLFWNVVHPADDENGRKLEAALLASIQDPDREVRINAVNALSSLNGDSDAALRSLGYALEDYDPSVRRAAVIAVTKAGSRGKVHLPTLMRISKDDQDRELRDTAGIAVHQLREMPDVGSFWTWIILISLAISIGVVTYLWLVKAAKSVELPKRKPLLGGMS